MHFEEEEARAWGVRVVPSSAKGWVARRTSSVFGSPSASAMVPVGAICRPAVLRPTYSLRLSLRGTHARGRIRKLKCLAESKFWLTDGTKPREARAGL